MAYGYEQRFLQHREEIMGHLLDGGGPDPSMAAFDLVAYVRRSVHRHGAGAMDRLERVGIRISDQEFDDISRQMEALDVPREICDRCPEWDPVQLDVVFRSHAEAGIPPLPRTPFASDFVDRLLDVLDTLRTLVPYYYTKMLGIEPGPRLRSVAISAQRWCREERLRDIIRWGINPADLSWEQIDARLNDVTKTVMYELPRILRPAAIIESGENPIIGFMELGAYQPETRRLIELGLPRETAAAVIRASGPLPTVPGGMVDDGALAAAARRVSSQLDFWDRLQIDAVL